MLSKNIFELAKTNWASPVVFAYTLYKLKAVPVQNYYYLLQIDE